MTTKVGDATASRHLLRDVVEANRELVTRGLVHGTWGNASARDRATGCVVIKPSGVPVSELRAEMLVTVTLAGEQVGGALLPSTDTATHLELYRAFPALGGIVHTHSPSATAWAQAGRSLPVLGSTHADCFAGDVPCTRALTDDEVAGAYEHETGRVIIEAVAGEDPLATPAVLVRCHAPFAWGVDVGVAVAAAAELELVAALALGTLAISPTARPIPESLRRRHFDRKHGASATYGQRPSEVRP